MTTPETPEQRRARKAADRAEAGRRLEAELEADHLKPLPDKLSFAECQMEHGRLRMKIMEFQQMVIQGKLDLAKAQDLERRMVEQIHRIEERARSMQTGGHVPQRGER